MDIVSLLCIFVAAATWRSATARDFEPLCFLLNQLAIAKFTKAANDNQQS
jgi:hypothetical protein